MNIESMKIFVDVAKLGSFAMVARKNNVDPSSISRVIAGLENQLGFRLFQRTTRQLTMTEAGEIYLHRIAPLLLEFDAALDDANKVNHGPHGTLRFSASVAFGQTCILPHLKEFKSKYPEIKIELLLTDTVVDMVADKVDLVCRLASQVAPELVAVKWFDTKYRVCVSSDYFASMPRIKQPMDLQSHDCLVFTLPEYRSTWMFRDASKHITAIDISSELAMSSALALKEAAIAGMGPVLLADWLVDKEIASDKLISVLDDYEVAAEGFDTAAWLLYPSRHFLPNKTRVMIDFLKSKRK